MPQTTKQLPLAFYQNETFSDIAATRVGGAIWTVLASDKGLLRMEAAARNGESSVLPLEKELRDCVETMDGPPELKDRYKSMCLNMARCIMELRGWEHVACALSPGRYFTSSGIFKRVS